MNWLLPRLVTRVLAMLAGGLAGFLLGRPVPVAQLASQGGPLAGAGPAPAPAEPEIRLYG